MSTNLCAASIAPAFRQAPTDLRFAFAVAAFADVLRGSDDAHGWSLDQIARVARGAQGVHRAFEADLHRRDGVLHDRVHARDGGHVHDVRRARGRLLHERHVAHVAHHQLDELVLVEPRGGERVAAQRVHHAHAVARIEQPATQGGANETRAARDQDRGVLQQGTREYT